MEKLRRLAIIAAIVGMLTPLLSACGERQESGQRETTGNQSNEHRDQDRDRNSGTEKHDD